MSEVDKDLSERYRAASAEEPPPHVDAAIFAAAKRAVDSRPQATWTPRAMRRWYVPVSLAAVLVLSVVVTLQVERERPETAMPDAVPLERKDQVLPAQPSPPPPAAIEPKAKTETGSAATPAAEPARKEKLQEDAPRAADAAGGPSAAGLIARKKTAEIPAAPAILEAPPARAFAPDPKPAAEQAKVESRRQDALRAADAVTESPAAAAGEAAGARREARAMSAPASAAAPAPAPALAAAKSNLAKRDLAPEEWLERIAELRKQRLDREADEQFAEFRRRYPDYKIPEAMTERIAPRK